MRYSGHLIDLCKDILALWVYDELTKNQVVRCRKTRSLGVHVHIQYMICKDYAEIRLRDLKCRRSSPKQPHAAARQEPDLAYGEAAGLKRGRVRPPRELVYAGDASPGSRGSIIAAIFIRCPAQRTLLTFGLQLYF